MKKFRATLPKKFLNLVEKIPYNIQDLNEETLKSFVDSVFICTGSDYSNLLINNKNNG